MTTIAPTTLLTTAAPTTTLTTAAPTTVADVEIIAGPAYIRLIPKAIRSDYPAHGRDTSLDFFYWADPTEITITPLGEMSTVSIDGPIGTITFVALGTLVLGTTINASATEIELVPSPHSIIVVEGRRCNFVKWSKIGSLDFTIDTSNVAGERPLDWKGCVYELLKLNKVIVAYGENGVTVLSPTDIKWGAQTIHRIGLVHKNSVVGTEFEHYFIDKTYRLYKLTESEGLRILDYSEYLSLMTNPKMSLDINSGIIYICDGTYGFVYSTRTGSFGEGPVNISGLGVQSGTLYVAADGDIEVPKFYITTDIYDFGTRKPKTIKTVEVGTDLSNKLEVMIETRLNNRKEFNQSLWKLVNPNGIAHIPCYGIEFKFNLRSYIYEQFDLDYLKVDGEVHEFNYLNAIQ